MKTLIRFVVAGAALAAFATAARADEIVLRADRPIVEVTINGKPARMLVDLTLPDMMAFNPDTTSRLGVRPIPGIGGRAVFDDASIRGRIARPRVVFANGKSSRAFTGLFGAPWSSDMAGIDGAMGPGVLPYDRVRVVVRDGAGGTARSHRLRQRESWDFEAPLADGVTLVSFNLSRTETMINRPAAQFMDEKRLLSPAGDVRTQRFFLGLSTSVQPSNTDVRVAGLPMGLVLARTPAPLVGPDDMDIITVTADAAKPRRRVVTLGRDALAQCYEFLWERASGALSVRCDY